MSHWQAYLISTQATLARSEPTAKIQFLSSASLDRSVVSQTNVANLTNPTFPSNQSQWPSALRFVSSDLDYCRNAVLRPLLRSKLSHPRPRLPRELSLDDQDICGMQMEDERDALPLKHRAKDWENRLKRELDLPVSTAPSHPRPNEPAALELNMALLSNDQTPG